MNELLKPLVGRWEGTCKTWLRPGELADESEVRGEFRPLLEGALVRHTYTGTWQGRPRTGEETIGFNPGLGRFQVAWFDTFHMAEGLLFSEGTESEGGFTVEGRYGVAPGQPTWGWRTTWCLDDPDHLTITAYNVTPEGEAAKAVETIYLRQSRGDGQ